VADMAAFAIQYGYNERFCGELNSENPLDAYAKVGQELFMTFGMTPFMDSFQAAEDLDPTKNLDFALRQWMYQSCTEFGYYQVAYHDPSVTVRSTKIDLDYHNKVCERLFGLKNSVDFEKTNRTYYEPLLDTSTQNIFFTNGSNDPWSNLSITKELGNNVNPFLTVMTIPGASHCNDLGGQQLPDLVAARAKFIELARGWLGIN
jgi:hypothetical protein